MSSATKSIVVPAEERSERGKNANRRLRAGGKVPGNLYGLNKAPMSVAVDPKKIEELLRLDTGRNTIFSLSLSGGSQTREVMFRELQRDPVTDRLIHVDFIRFDPTKKIEVDVPVQLLGIPEGVKNEGGVIDFVNRTVEVSCMPTVIPEHVDVDVSELHINQNVSIKDLQPVEGVEVLGDPDTILAVVSASRAEVSTVEEEEAAAEEEGAAEKEGEGEKEGKPEESEGSSGRE